VTLRVVQWATGNIGTRSLRAVIEHPELELVGLFVYSEAKEGRDAGELCGLPPVGVAATRDVDAVLALKPDCVLYMADRADHDLVCRILSSGANIVSTRGEYHRPDDLEPEVRARIEAACEEGGTSLHSTGSSPGFITEALPIVLTSISRRLDSLVIDEFADLTTRNSPELLFNVMGFGKAPEKFDQRRWAHGAAAFGPSLRVTASALGLPLDDVTSSGEVGVATKDIEIAAGTVPEGTVAAQRMVVSGMHDGRALLQFRANWYCGTAIDQEWELRSSGWRVVVQGDTPLDIGITFPVAPEDYAAFTPGLTAHRPVNAVAAVCAAPPGIRTTPELPQIVARLG
jgi:hypothetical protein